MPATLSAIAPAGAAALEPLALHAGQTAVPSGTCAPHALQKAIVSSLGSFSLTVLHRIIRAFPAHTSERTQVSRNLTAKQTDSYSGSGSVSVNMNPHVI